VLVIFAFENLSKSTFGIFHETLFIHMYCDGTAFTFDFLAVIKLTWAQKEAFGHLRNILKIWFVNK